MRILFVNQFYRPDVAATGQLLADLAEKLARENHQISVLCSRKSYLGGGKKYQKHQIIENVHIHRVRVVPSVHWCSTSGSGARESIPGFRRTYCDRLPRAVRCRIDRL